MPTIPQLAILQFIRTHTEATGDSPTMAEIEAEFDWITPETVNDMVQYTLNAFLEEMRRWQVASAH